ncbi:hypothetical protein AURDEDRAFT_111723 [Auricularia subglabra TFB-10046 SS5]|nr:hypothetical protein AURDEDRAFT_111723 [Auricularia subglabra TFB-10046 SS5]
MVNWQDPVTLLLCARAFEILTSICFGLYLWEFLVSFPFDWEHFTLRRPFRWTFCIYFLARYLILLGLIAGVRISNVLNPIDCDTWNHLVYASAHGCFVFSSLLLLMRVTAIAGRNMWLSLFLGTFYLGNVGTLVHGISLLFMAVHVPDLSRRSDGGTWLRCSTMLHSSHEHPQAKAVYIPQLFLCGAANTVASRINVFTSFAFDLTCLITMLVLLMRTHGGDLWTFLVAQGIMYFVVTAVSYLIPAIFLVLNLNVTSMAICATRMYRHLSTFDTHNGEAFSLSGPSVRVAAGTWPPPRPTGIVGGVSIDVQITRDIDLESQDRDRKVARTHESSIAKEAGAL